MTDTQNPLEHLVSELDERGWRAHHTGDALKVVSPATPSLNDEIACDGVFFRWAWGQAIGLIDDVASTADRIVYVLREVGV